MNTTTTANTTTNATMTNGTSICSKGYTHGGNFHADDVFSAAMLRMLNPSIKIERGFKPPVEDESYIVFDIGGGRFDHHQENALLRENGERYCSFGLLWRAYGTLLVETERAMDAVDKSFVSEICHNDNSSDTSAISIMIASFNTNWDNIGASSDEAFFQAVSIAEVILGKIVDRELSKNRADEIAQKSIAQPGQVAVLDKFVPVKFELMDSKLAMVYPSLRGGWNLELLKKDGRANLEFPASWLGAMGEKADSHYSGMSFCHIGNWMATFKTREIALKCYEELLCNTWAE